MAKILSANRLNDGIVVYAGAYGRWVETIEGAALLDTAESVETALVAARADEALNLIVDPFVVDVLTEDGRPRPRTLRDRIRAGGPTIPFGAAAQTGSGVP